MAQVNFHSQQLYICSLSCKKITIFLSLTYPISFLPSSTYSPSYLLPLLLSITLAYFFHLAYNLLSIYLLRMLPASRPSSITQQSTSPLTNLSSCLPFLFPTFSLTYPTYLPPSFQTTFSPTYFTSCLHPGFFTSPLNYLSSCLAFLLHTLPLTYHPYCLSYTFPAFAHSELTSIFYLPPFCLPFIFHNFSLYPTLPLTPTHLFSIFLFLSVNCHRLSF